jgi:hypothetical protein
MRSRFNTLLVTCLLLASITAKGGEMPVEAVDRIIEPTKASYSTSRYSGRWCIVTFIEQSRLQSPGTTLTFTASEYTYSSLLARRSVLGSGSPLPYRPSFIDNLVETRYLRLMTLWRGHENALLLGIDEHGLLGVTLD